MSPSRQPTKPAYNDASLTDILTTPALRVELATLTALCSDAMRRDLLTTFEPNHRPARPESHRTNGEVLVDCEQPAESIAESEIEMTRIEEVDLNSTQTQGLRRAAITYFDKWQIDVLRRLGEVLSVRPDAVRKARADAKARVEAVAKARRDKAYWDWANGMEERTIERGEMDEDDVLPQGFQAKILRLPKDKRIVILDSVLLLLLSLETYTAHSRVLMLKLTLAFRLPESTLTENESKIAKGLLASAAANMSADESTKRQATEDASARRWKVGLATVAGAALIGVTGGLAAPILAAGVGGIMGGLGLGAVASLLGPLATNMLLVGGMFGAYGGRMTGQIMEKYALEIRDFKFVPVSSDASEEADLYTLQSQDDTGLEQLQSPTKRNAHKLRVAIGISGSVTEPEDFISPWTVFSESRIEAFGLRWEMDALTQLGRKMSEILRAFVWDFAKFQLLSLVLAGLWPFGLLRAAGTLDSPFAIAKTRSDRAGKVLADALINKVQGARPVTLVGYGLGARVIYSCLLQLADLNAFGLVESAVFMGAPTPREAPTWRRIRAVVSGRVVNVYSANDFMLGFLYRTSSVQTGIAGVQEVDGVAGVENYDFTDVIKGHDKYPLFIGTILHRVGFADIDSVVVRQQQETLRRLEERDKDERRPVKATEEQAKDNILAKEDADGLITLLDNGKTGPRERHECCSEQGRNTFAQISIHQDARDETDEDGNTEHQIQMEDNDEQISILDPEPEPDYGPDREMVSFGSGLRGFNLEWDKYQ